MFSHESYSSQIVSMTLPFDTFDNKVLIIKNTIKSSILMVIIITLILIILIIRNR